MVATVPPKDEDFAEKKVGILLLEDNEDDAHFILSEMRKGGIAHVAKCVAKRSEFIAELEQFKPDLVLSDYKLPEFAELEQLHIVRRAYPDLPFILVTGALGEELSVEIIKEGATDYILKDRLFRLVPAVERALREAEERRRRREGDELLKKQHEQLQRQNAALQESDERFRQLAENIREVFWMTDTRKKEFIYVSPGYETIWGRSCKRLYESAREWRNAIHGEDRELVSRALEKQVSGGYDEIYRIVRPDRSIRWIHDRAFPVRNEAGEVYRVTGIAEDITERKMGEKRLEARNEVIRALAVSGTLREASERILESICKCLDWDFGAFWEMEREPQALRCLTLWRSDEGQAQEFVDAIQNKRYRVGEEFPGQIWKLGRPVWRPNADEETSFVFPRAPIAARCGLRGAFGFPVLVRDEVVGVVEFFSRQIREPDKASLEMVSALGHQIGQFISRKRAEEALREAEENYRGIYENAIEGIFQTTPEGRYLSANPSLARMLGYVSPEELVASITDLGSQMCVRPEIRVELKRRLETEGQVRGFENQIYRKDGSKIWISVNAHIVRDADGKVLYYEGTSQDITERKRAEEALRESEERFRQLAENIREVFWMTDPSKNETIYVSPGYEAVWGRSCEKLYESPRDWVDAIHHEDRDRVLKSALKKQSTGEYNETYRIVRPDGSIRWIHDRAFPIRNERGEVYRVTGIAEDITEWKLAEAKLATLAHAVESTDELICITDLEDRFTFANPAFLKAYGYTEAEIVGKTPKILFSPENPPELLGEILKMTREEGWQGEVIDRRKDGSDFPISLGTSQIRNSEGQVIGLIGVARDITERKRAEAVLKESEEKFRTLFESAPIGMALHDAKGRYVQTNQAYQRMLGYNNEELRHLSVRRITHPDDVLEGQRFFEEFRAGQRDRYQREKRYLRKDGSLVWAHASASAIRNNKGELIYIISMVEDITERKELEQEVIETSANERRRVGHELHDGLGQYLAGIAFKAKALEQTLVGESLPHGMEARELAALVSNAISQTRSLARGLDPIEVETIGLPAALENLAVETQKFFGISCQFRCGDGLLADDPQVSLALYRIVQEAIHNGITHGDARTIEIELSIKASNLCLRVHDDGTGFQPDDTRQRGIGLRVMHYRARSIGGSLHITSQPEQGTEVSCVVPRMIGARAYPPGQTGTAEEAIVTTDGI
jgi:PAS domain S-box-containing protein